MWIQQIESLVSRHFKGRSSIRMLEAGGGKRSNFALPPNVHLTVIDIDPVGLDRNQRADKKILGNLQSHHWTQEFDLIVCWDVLEHLESPAAAIERLSAALANDGLLVIKGPLPRSMKGVVTRLLPHRAHIAYYRYVLGARNAGMQGAAPFKAYLKPESDCDWIGSTLAARGFELVQVSSFTTHHVESLKKRLFPVYLAYSVAGAVVRGLTLGRFGGADTDFYLIARKS